MTALSTPAFDYRHYDYPVATLRELYRDLLLPRLIEEKMLILLRQGKISKWFSGIGQEGVAVGTIRAVDAETYILPLHRNLGVFTTRGVPLRQLFAQFQGKAEGFTKGRDRSFHFGTPTHRIVGMISHLGPQLAVADGIALAQRLRDTPGVTVAFSGDGGTSEGDFHEALNVAAVWDLPVIFVVENNGYGLSTPSAEQFRCAQLADRGVGYGMEAHTVEGNNVLAVYDTVRRLASDLRARPRPVLVEAMTFRMRGHEEASGTKYVPAELLDAWQHKDPLTNYEAFLLEEEIITEAEKEAWRQELKAQVDGAWREAAALPSPHPAVTTELADVYAPHVPPPAPPNAETTDLRLVDALNEALHLAMEHHDNLVLMGQDVAEYGGVFKVTAGLRERYGARVRNTPLCESAIVGAGLGLSVAGYKAMVEMQFADFVTCGFNQIVNNLAKVHYRWGQSADVVVRMPTGGGVGAGPFHSQSNEAWFFHTPGLKVVYPATPADAKGLLLAALDDPNPVLFFEHKALYRAAAEPVPTGYYTLPIGQARVVQEGADATIVTYGIGVRWAQRAAASLPDYRVEIIDLRSLLPWDEEAVRASVRKTSRALVLHEDCLTGGVGGELAAWIGQHCFEHLDAPVVRVGSLDTPVPFHPDLENQFLPENRLKDELQRLLTY